jgi:hypothetical protein
MITYYKHDTYAETASAYANVSFKTDLVTRCSTTIVHEPQRESNISVGSEEGVL